MSESTNPSKSARRFGAGALAATLAAGLLAGGGAVILLRRGGPAPALHADGAEAKKPLYQCPMHPTITADHPGDCPICGMKLVEVKPGGAPAERKVAFYRSPMDPKQTSPTPRKDEMGMDYLPVYADELGSGPPVEGLATVQIDPARQQLIGLRTAPVAAGPVGGAWRTVGRVAVDETRVHHVNVKVDGFVDRIFLDFTGQAVRRGQPLFALYAPELLSLQEEYLLAVKVRRQLGGGALAGSGDDLVRSARERLKLWDVPDAAIDELERTGKPRRDITFVSPISGVVTKKDVVQGHKLSAGDMPYEITDLSEVWVLADVYEPDLARTRVGMPATFVAQAYPNRTFSGRVAFVDPVLDPKTRTAKVRLAFPNPRDELKPEMFGDVVLRAKPREGLRIPGDAVIDTGTKKVVFLSLGDGKFEPRAVDLGATDGDHVELVSGLRAGDQVVVRANFLVDSESRLKASLAGIGGK